MLGELEKRLTEPPNCLPACAAVEQRHGQTERRCVDVAVEHQRRSDRRGTAAGHRRAMVAARWRATAIGPAVVSRDEAGQLSIALKEGAHSIELSGPVTHVDRFELPFPMPPGSVSLDLKGWRAYGEQNGHLRGARAAVRARGTRPLRVAPPRASRRNRSHRISASAAHSSSASSGAFTRRSTRIAPRSRQHPLCGSVGSRRVAARRPRARRERTHHRRAAAGRTADRMGQRARDDRHAAAHRSAAARNGPNNGR